MIVLFCVCLIGSLKRNKHLGEFTQNKVEADVSKWLTGSRDRDGKTTDRAKAEKEKARKRRLEDESDDYQDSEAGSRVERVKEKTNQTQKRKREEEACETDD
jgi:hypothetical protein